MKLVVTGSASFIGGVLLARCKERGIEVVGIDNAKPSAAGLCQADIRDPAVADVMPEKPVVVHLAAMSRDSDCRADPAGAIDVNVKGTLNIAAAAQKRKATQLLFASSEWVYGDVSNDQIQCEDQPIDITSMKSAYALTKIVGEQCLRLGCSLPGVTILRFGIVYGPRPANWSAVESLFDSVRTKDEISVGALRTARRFIHVDDIVSGIFAGLGRRGFEIFNLSGDRPVSLGEIIETSAKLLKRRPRVVESDPARPSIRNPDNSKARRTLGWQPAIDIEAGIAGLLRNSPTM